MNAFRDPAENQYLPLPAEYWEMAIEREKNANLSRVGGSSKYSPAPTRKPAA